MKPSIQCYKCTMIKLYQFQNISQAKINSTMDPPKPKCIEPKRCLDLVIGSVGIYVMYLLAGIFQEWMIKVKYNNDATNKLENFDWPIGLLMFPTGITWLIGWAVNKFTIPAGTQTHIPVKKILWCAIAVATSTITYTYAIYWTNFPLVMMVKSCNLLSVILVGVLCSRVKDKNLKLGGKKILVGIIVTIGIVLFKWFDPESGKKEEKKTEIFGIILLLISLLADGFLPDFQAQIKSVYKPQPMEMMTQINKWVCLISFALSIVTGQIVDIIQFIFTHQLFIYHTLLNGLLSTFGQMFVYRMIKQFRQHLVPFVITTRKIVTVGLSILYFHHETSTGQIAGILLVFGIVTFQFVTEMMDAPPEHHNDAPPSAPQTSPTSQDITPPNPISGSNSMMPNNALIEQLPAEQVEEMK